MRPSPLHGEVRGAVWVQFEVQAGQTSAGCAGGGGGGKTTDRVCVCRRRRD